MVRLVARTPCEGLLPLSHGSVRLEEVLREAIASVAPLRGREREVSDALKAAIGAAFPSPGRTSGTAGAQTIWSGAGQVLLLGPAVAIDGAAVTDQSDGWACLALEGPDARAVLARLVPIDLREDVFRTGHAARTLLGHMTCALWREGADRYGLLVFRSMARTAVHDLEAAMQSVAAQKERGARYGG